MATTVQVTEETLRDLAAVKSALGASSYDVVIRRLLTAHRARTSPLRGLAPGLGPFEREHAHRD